jgi:hypothetical protein
MQWELFYKSDAPLRVDTATEVSWAFPERGIFDCGQSRQINCRRPFALNLQTSGRFNRFRKLARAGQRSIVGDLGRTVALLLVRPDKNS